MAFNFAERISVLVTAAVALATFAPAIALSQSTPSNPGRADVLNLTPEQLQQIGQIYINTQQQMEAVLTPEQRSRFRQAIQSGQNPRAAILSLNLRPEQLNRIRSIDQNFQQQVQVKIRIPLTPEQFQRLQNQFQQQRNR